MKIQVFLEREKKEKTLKLKSGKVRDLLKILGINPEAVIIARGRDLVTADFPLKDGERFRIIHIKASD